MISLGEVETCAATPDVTGVNEDEALFNSSMKLKKSPGRRISRRLSPTQIIDKIIER